MATRSGRRDPYGKPLPTLVEAAQESLYGRTTNEDLRRRIADLLNIYYDTLLRRDVSAEMSLSFRVVEGIIQDDLRVGLNRVYRTYRGAGS
jgi:hypothetical protein